MGKYVTGPWMRWISQQSTILEVNVLLNEALVRIGDWARDPFPLLCSTVDYAFPGCSIKKDAVYSPTYHHKGCHSVSDEGPHA